MSDERIEVNDSSAGSAAANSQDIGPPTGGVPGTPAPPLGPLPIMFSATQHSGGGSGGGGRIVSSLNLTQPDQAPRVLIIQNLS